MVDWYLGTMGFSYKDWNGVFYPPDLDPRNYLAYYSRIFNAVEVDSTFYGIPRSEAVNHWRAITPDQFKICTKTPRIITHEMALISAGQEMNSFLDSIRLLEEQLGPVLIQFPPSFHADQFQVLDNFLASLPSDVRFSVEFRHRSWYTPNDKPGESEVARMLEKYNICWASTQYPGLPVRIHPTTDFLYIRWIGQHGSFKTHSVERIDRTADLAAWWQILQEFLDQVGAVYGFFNNDYAGFAPATCNQFKAIAGLPVEKFQPPQQPALF